MNIGAYPQVAPRHTSMRIRKSLYALAVLALSYTFAVQAQQPSAHRANHQALMASRANSTNRVRLLEGNVLPNVADVAEPGVEVFAYGMDSRRVNPFSESQVPDRAVIDVRGYHMPVPGKVSSNYGYRAKFGRMHKGIDLHLRTGDTIYAAFDGKVRVSSYEAKGFGNYLIIRHPNKLETIYGHMNRALVKEGQTVRAGQPIGLGGSTGRSTGPHLHFETRYMGYAINPAAIFDFANHTTHSDYYTFTKKSYTQARNYASSVPAEQESVNTAYKPAAPNTAGTYTVRTGDTITSVALSNGLSRTRLMQLNGLTSQSVLKPGQVLKVK